MHHDDHVNALTMAQHYAQVHGSGDRGSSTGNGGGSNSGNSGAFVAGTGGGSSSSGRGSQTPTKISTAASTFAPATSVKSGGKLQVGGKTTAGSGEGGNIKKEDDECAEFRYWERTASQVYVCVCRGMPQKEG